MGQELLRRTGDRCLPVPRFNVASRAYGGIDRAKPQLEGQSHSCVPQSIPRAKGYGPSGSSCLDVALTNCLSSVTPELLELRPKRSTSLDDSDLRVPTEVDGVADLTGGGYIRSSSRRWFAVPSAVLVRVPSQMFLPTAARVVWVVW